MFSPDLYQPSNPDLRLSVRRFQAIQVTEDSLEDLVMWTEGSATGKGITLPTGYPVPFGDWVVRQEGMFLGVADAKFQAEYVPA